MSTLEKKPIIVNVDNFVRAETNMQFDRNGKVGGGVNALGHLRKPTPIEAQTVIRMNRDTLYSFAVVDISKGATLSMPDAGNRYMTAMVVNQDHYVNRVYNQGGTYHLSMEEFDTPYVFVAARTLVDASDEVDIKKVNELQDLLKIEAASANPFVMPDYDMKSYKKTFNALLELGRGVEGAFSTFGKKEDVNPIRHLIGTCIGWGGLPVEEAFYENVEPNLPVAKYQITVKDVPCDAFWSVSLYNKEGFFQKNDLNAYSVNNITGTPNKDGSVTVHFGGCEDGRVNCLPIMEGWNYTVRMYRPRDEMLKGKYKFPKPEPAL
jgi:hypothetical protein